MDYSNRYTTTIALAVALGGFLMGFDASVISGVVTFIESEFALSKLELGWAVASLTLTATTGMMFAGPLSDRLGRRPVLMIAAAIFLLSAIGSAVAPDYATLVLARMVGGLAVGAALIVAPMYIAEVSPPEIRGRTVSFNQLNIVIGISAAFFSNYLVLRLGQSDATWVHALRGGEWNWRWMLGLEALPATLYLLALTGVPESPRWLVMHGRDDEALRVLSRFAGSARAESVLAAVRSTLKSEGHTSKGSLRELFHPAMKLVLVIGVSVAILQQITGINAVFFYAPMIFEQSGIGTDAAFMQAVLVGLVNVAFTVLAILLIDRLGRRPLLMVGLAGIAASMFLLSYGFGAATYTLDADTILSGPLTVDREALRPLLDQTFPGDVVFRDAVIGELGVEVYKANQSALIAAAIEMNPTIVLVGVLGFVASFAVSLGPVMWVLFSELFPNRIRGVAISFVGVINSAVSFVVQLVFPWELEQFGNAATFLIYGIFAIVGLVIVARMLPETKGSSLEELEIQLARP